MRIKNSIVNLIYIWGSALLIAVLSLVTRRLFLDSLEVDYLGYDGLFTSIFSFLTLSEMGIASIITYHMYSEIASDNKEQIQKLLYMYKLIYKVVGLFVLAAGIAAGFLLPLLLRNHAESWQFIYVIYYLQLTATLCTYFLAYRRILFVTHQKIYFCTMVDTIVTILSTCCKMAVLVIWKSYIAYLVVGILNHVIANLVIAWRSRVSFPEITKTKVTKEDFQKLNLWHDVKNMMATKIAGTIYGSSDSIIITAILGVGTVGLVNNYLMISSKIQEFILSIFQALQASIGNLVYDKDTEKGVGFFHALDLIGFYLGLTAAMGMVAVGQDFILVWLKKQEFQLPFLFLVLLSFNVFIAICNNPMNYFRNTLGHFESDRNYMIAAAAVNVILTLLLAFPMGVAGVMVGTVAGHLLIFMGRTVVVYKHYAKRPPMEYYMRFLVRVLLFILAAAGTVGVVKLIPGGIGGVLIKALISVLVSTGVFLLYSFKREEFSVLLSYVRTVVSMIVKKRGKEK
ncbi:MAG: oligosaccharide flippase family protein [Lachnospiraceae bacterium]|nr:oligosaccharide flippase family protein [Lachnospiraceae bacterium]